MRESREREEKEARESGEEDGELGPDGTRRNTTKTLVEHQEQAATAVDPGWEVKSEV